MARISQVGRVQKPTDQRRGRQLHQPMMQVIGRLNLEGVWNIRSYQYDDEFEHLQLHKELKVTVQDQGHGAANSEQREYAEIVAKKALEAMDQGQEEDNQDSGPSREEAEAGSSAQESLSPMSDVERDEHRNHTAVDPARRARTLRKIVKLGGADNGADEETREVEGDNAVEEEHAVAEEDEVAEEEEEDGLEEKEEDEQDEEDEEEEKEEE